jgi:mycothione reductase
MKHYDLVVVGSGAGLTVLETAWQHGLRCALVEKDQFGGTCLNRGCIPSKLLAYPADVIREAEHARKIGLDFRLESFDWPLIAQRMWQYIADGPAIEASLRRQPNLAVYRGTGTFISPYTMQVADEADGQVEPFQADQYVLAPGARTRIPKIAGLEETGYVTSESFFGDKFPAQPWESLAIVGGGATGVEFAHVFSAFGTRVTLIEQSPHLVPREEEKISELLAEHFTRLGIQVLVGHDVTAVRSDAGGKQLTARSLADGSERVVTCEEILLTSGVRPNSDLLHLEKTGVAVDIPGYIITDEYLQTSQKNIWALGDVNGRFQFRHKAEYEANLCVHNLLHAGGGMQAARYDAVPWAIFTCPQIAHVGLREQEIRASGRKYRVGINRYSAVVKGHAMGYDAADPDNGFIKLIVDESDRIIGVHIIGPHAAMLLQPFVYLMNAGFSCSPQEPMKKGKTVLWPRKIPDPPACPEGGTFDPIAHSMTIHPSLSELAAWAIGHLAWVD